MSAGHNDEERLARWHLRKDEQDRLIERFKDRKDPLGILVVCDMLLTGFDAPAEQVMYLDAPLREHTLLQAIARVNRPQGDEKTYGLVVDYWGVSAKLQEALAIFSSAEVQGALTPSVDELPRLESRHAAAMRFFQKVGDRNDLNACVKVLEPEDVRAAFDLAIRCSARRKKTVAVTVDPAGGVVLLAPEHSSPDELDAIVARKAEWIVRRLRHTESHGPTPSPREFVSGESALYLGRHYRLKVQPEPHASGEAKLRGGWLHVPAPEGERQPVLVREALIAWFRRHAAKRLPERVAAWRARAGVPMPPVIVSNQQKRWGSCDRNGTIRLNWRIIQAPMRLVDYVVVHELVHLRHRGHGREYWQALGRVMPDYERRREDLRRCGAGLAW